MVRRSVQVVVMEPADTATVTDIEPTVTPDMDAVPASARPDVEPVDTRPAKRTSKLVI